MLDSNKDNLKLEAMKRIIGMVAKGRDASDLFPAVVKNVVSKNIEVKKLVYVYLVRYAEEQQDIALLSISTFQRALKVNYQFQFFVLININYCYYFISMFAGSKSINKSRSSSCTFKYSSLNDCSNCNACYS